MKRTAMLVLLASATLLLQGCKTGYNKPLDHGDGDDDENVRTCDETPSNANADAAAIALYNRLRNLSCTDTNPQGVLMGQSAGAGDQMTTDQDLGFDRLFGAMTSDYQVTPAVISVDYEGDRVFSDAELIVANNQMLELSGIISISWSPLNPWVSDSVPGSGSSDDLAWTEDVNIEALLDPDSDIYQAWKNRVDRLVNLLRGLENQGVAVLWRPLPEMNSPDVWWGVQTGNTDAAPYKKLWKQLYDRFREENLNNLLWVYSPVEGTSLPSEGGDAEGAPFTWAYPGDSQVDIVAPVIRDNELDISDYSRMTNYKKPLGLAEYGPLYASGADGGGDDPFDASLYASTLAEDYPAIAYWVSSHAAPLIDMDPDSMQELAEDDYILTLNEIGDIKAD